MDVGAYVCVGMGDIFGLTIRHFLYMYFNKFPWQNLIILNLVHAFGVARFNK